MLSSARKSSRRGRRRCTPRSTAGTTRGSTTGLSYCSPVLWCILCGITSCILLFGVLPLLLLYTGPGTRSHTTRRNLANTVSGIYSPQPPPPPPPPPSVQRSSASVASPPSHPLPMNAPAATTTTTTMISGENKQKRDAIVSAFKHAYHGYEKACFGKDLLKPVSGTCDDQSHMSLAVTIVDSLDSLILMGLDDEYVRALKWITEHFNPTVNAKVSFFETNIRVVGGLLGAYELSGESMLLDKAYLLVQRLLHAFAPSGVVKSTVNLANGATSTIDWTGGNSLLAEVATFQVEFLYLAHHKSDDMLRTRVNQIMKTLENANVQRKYQWPIYVTSATSMPQFIPAKVTWGAMGDSAYEYLLKTYLMDGKRNEQWRTMYEGAVAAMEETMLRTEGVFTYISELANTASIPKMDQLVCFAPGMLAMGVHHGVVTGATAQNHMGIAEALMETCYHMYSSTHTGLSPEYVTFQGRGMHVGAPPEYQLRPETIESLFILWRITRKPMYRDRAWRIFTSIDKYCRVEHGYAGVKNVESVDTTATAANKHVDRMESYFLSETLKYLYLIFSPDDTLDISTYVFNTEGHALRPPPPSPSSSSIP